MLVVVITYRPAVAVLTRNLACLAPFATEVVVWQNTPLAERASYPLPQLPNITLMGDEGNVGISVAFNRVLAYARQKGYRLMLTMDQDSLFSSFSAFQARVRVLLPLFPNAIAFGPEVNAGNIPAGQARKVPYLINSGTIVDVEKCAAMGGWNERFFLDGIDIDFGYKALSHGYEVYQVGGFCLQQTFGNTTTKAGIRYAEYPPHRLRATVSAYWAIVRAHWPCSWPLIPEVINRFYLRKSIAILLFQKDKWQKLKAIWL